MVITGQLSGTSVILDLLGCYAGGATKAEAYTTLAAMIREMAAHDSKPVGDFDVTITDDGTTVYVASNDHARLLATVLRHQREFHQLSLADVTERLGMKSRSSYADYEQGRAEPTLGKLNELLAVVAPELVLMLAPRGAAVQVEQRPMRPKERRGPKPRRRVA